MSEVSVHDQVPRGALVGIGILLAVSLVAVTAVRVSGIDVRVPDAEAVATRDLPPWTVHAGVPAKQVGVRPRNAPAEGV